MNPAAILSNPDGNPQACAKYDSVEFSLADGQTNYDVDDQQSDFLSDVLHPYYLELFTTQNITVKFNSTSNPSITVKSTDSPRVFDRQEITNIYLTNASGTSSDIRMYLK